MGTTTSALAVNGVQQQHSGTAPGTLLTAGSSSGVHHPSHGLVAGSQHAAGSKFTPSDGFFLINAARAGDTELLTLFLDKNPALAWAVSAHDLCTPWHCAAEEGHVQALERLAAVSQRSALSNTFNPTGKAVNQEDAKGRTPLMLACRGGHFACAQLLIALGASVGGMDRDGFTALHHAALAPSGGCTLLLLKKAGLWGKKGPARPADPALLSFLNAGDVLYGRTPLHLAAWAGQLDGLAAVLKAGAHILAKTTADCYESSMPCNHGTTALHLAAMKGQQSAVVVIMEAYVRAVKRQPSYPDPRQATDAYGNTPFKIAASRRHDAPLMLQALNPDSVIVELQRIHARRTQEQQPPAANGELTASSSAAAAAASAAPKPQQEQQPAASGSGQQGGHSGAAGANGEVAEGGSTALGSPEPGSRGGRSRRRGKAGSRHSRKASSSGQAGALPSPSSAGGLGGAGGGEEGPAGGRGARSTQADYGGSQGGGEGEEEEDGDEEEEEDDEDEEEEEGGDDDSSITSVSGDGGTEEGSVSVATQPSGLHVTRVRRTQAGPATPGKPAAPGALHREGSGPHQAAAGAAAPPPPPPPPPRLSIKRLVRLVAVYDSARRALADGEGGDGSGAKAEGGLVAPGPQQMSGMGRGARASPPSSSGPAAATTAAAAAAAAAPPPSQQHTELSEHPVPDCYVCPLTCRVFRDPVVASDGFSYERVAIEKHIESGSLVSPSTKKRLTSHVLYPNHTLRSAVELWRATNNWQAPKDMQ